MIKRTPGPRQSGLGVALLALALNGTSGLAAAGPVKNPAAISGCAAISADLERLACYDRLSGRTGAGASTGEATHLSAPPPERTALSAPPASEPAASPRLGEISLLDSAWGFEPDSSLYTIALYRPNYLTLASYSTRPNEEPFKILFNALDNPDAELQSTEAEFQLSFKARLWATENRRLGIWGAYTQQSQWQVYNGDISRPFRETNYQPELLLSYKPDLSFGGFRWGLFNFGYNHQSNGRSDPI